MIGRMLPGTSPLLAGAAIAGCLGAPVAVAAGAPDAVRLAAAVPLFGLAPGVALVALLGRRDTRAGAALIVGLSLGVVVLVAQACLALGVWDPEAATFALAAGSLLALAAGLVRRRSSGTERPRAGTARRARREARAPALARPAAMPASGAPRADAAPHGELPARPRAAG